MSFNFCPPASSEGQVHSSETLYGILKPRENFYVQDIKPRNCECIMKTLIGI